MSDSLGPQTFQPVVMSLHTSFDQYHIEYLAVQYERRVQLEDRKQLLTKDKIETMRRAFRSFDKDGNGVLDRDEIYDLLTVHLRGSGVRQKPARADVDKFFDALDDDHSGEIEFEEFQDFMVQTMYKNLMIPLRDYLVLQGINVA